MTNPIFLQNGKDEDFDDIILDFSPVSDAETIGEYIDRLCPGLQDLGLDSDILEMEATSGCGADCVQVLMHAQQIFNKCVDASTPEFESVMRNLVKHQLQVFYFG